MASSLNRKLLLPATTSHFPFLYQTRTLSPWSTSLRKSVPRRCNHYDSRDYREIGVNESANEQSNTEDQKTQESQNAPSATPAQRPSYRMSYLQRKARARSANQPLSSPPSPNVNEPGYRFTEKERKVFSGLIKKSSPKKYPKPSILGDSQIETDTSQYIHMLGNFIAKNYDSPATSSNMRDEGQDPAPEAKPGFDEPAPLAEHPAETQDDIEADPTAEDDDIEADSTAEDEEEYILEPLKERPRRNIQLKDVVSANEEWDDKWENFLMTERQAIGMVIRREVTKITDRLLASIEEEKGDSGVWEVCTQQVFSIVHFLDQTDEPFKVAPTGIEIPPILPAELVIPELYPKLLLQVFRMLTTYFPDSPILGQFRSAVKAQGQESTFFAVSPALYDEMVIFFWDHAKDLSGVVSFLHDMHNGGLDPSQTVHHLLRRIVKERREDMKSVADGEKHEFWDIPSNRAAFEELDGPFGWVERSKAQSYQKRSKNRLPLPRFRHS